ncbi:MAG: hypothetical protein V7K38_14425 [Nostoc sp.]|uniref:hypothetical protein n=1 Tax=Nostoc sp. TaxID=1180 RepID=UPI002FF82611
MKLFTTLIATAVSVAAVAISAPAHALVFTQWNFNNSNLTPNIGTGTATNAGGTSTSFFGGTSSDTGSPNQAWSTTAYPGQNTGNKTAGAQFATSTVGYQNIIVTWDQRNSATASLYGQFQYSTDGNTFVDFGAPFVDGGNNTFKINNTVNLSSIIGVNNNSNFAFRLVSAFDPNTGNTSYTPTSGAIYASAGTRRFDLVTANGDAIAVPFDTPGGATIPTVGSLVALGAMIKVRKTIASKIANPVTSAVS